LSKRYINERFLPDKAIDVLDEACALAASKSENNEKNDNIFEQYVTYGDKQEQNALDIMSICQGEYPTVAPSEKQRNLPLVTDTTVRDIIAEACSIPSGMIQKSIDYDELEKHLNEAVLGQRDAVHRLVSVIKRSDLGFSGDDRPRGIFMFAGESGVGKTALATELEKSLYYDASHLLRFDMSEYSEKQSISKLIGSPPGYVGHEEGGTLTEAVRKRPHAVILFDEIEKADKEIMNIMLQISDYGYLTDSAGRHVSFKNAIIIATTNIGASQGSESVGFESNNDRKAKDYTSVLKKFYKEEFINRFDEIIVFQALDDSTLKEIIRDRLDVLSKSLSLKGYTFSYGDDVVELIAKKGRIKGLGARPSLRNISAYVEDRIIDAIINEDSESKDVIASVKNSDIEIQLKNAVKAQ
jgi:ATP-dependent Clp protease ATP-binding subunit ClpE